MIETDGKPEVKRVEVVGPESPFSVSTFGKPKSAKIDPNFRVLRNSDQLRIAAAIAKGDELRRLGDPTEAIAEFQRSSSTSAVRWRSTALLRRSSSSAVTTRQRIPSVKHSMETWTRSGSKSGVTSTLAEFTMSWGSVSALWVSIKRPWTRTTIRKVPRRSPKSTSRNPTSTKAIARRFSNPLMPIQLTQTWVKTVRVDIQRYRLNA
jgi:hypothetical protein